MFSSVPSPPNEVLTEPSPKSSSSLYLWLYALVDWRIRSIGLSFAHDRPGAWQMHPVSGFALDTRAFCIFAQKSGHAPIITHSALTSPLIFGCIALFSLALSSNHVMHRLSDPWLWLCHRYPGASDVLGDSIITPLARKKISHGHKKNRKTWFHPFVHKSRQAAIITPSARALIS